LALAARCSNRDHGCNVLDAYVGLLSGRLLVEGRGEMEKNNAEVTQRELVWKK
jgi:hypothetical protein